MNNQRGIRLTISAHKTLLPTFTRSSVFLHEHKNTYLLYFASILQIFCTRSACLPPSKVAPKNASKIFFASSFPTTRAPNAMICALLCLTVISAEYGSLHTAARIPGTFICRQRNSDTSSTDQNTFLNFTGNNSLCNFLSLIRIIYSNFCIICTVVYALITLLGHVLHQFFFSDQSLYDRSQNPLSFYSSSSRLKIFFIVADVVTIFQCILSQKKFPLLCSQPVRSPVGDMRSRKLLTN